MNNGTTRITYERVKQDANTINDCKKTMQAIFDDVKTTMNQATDPNSTEGKVAEAMKGRFNQLESRFQSYTSRIEQLYTLILANAEATEATEQRQEAQAENLSN